MIRILLYLYFLKNDFGEELVFKGEDNWDGGGGVERHLEQENHLPIFSKDLVCSSSVPFFISLLHRYRMIGVTLNAA